LEHYEYICIDNKKKGGIVKIMWPFNIRQKEKENYINNCISYILIAVNQCQPELYARIKDFEKKSIERNLAVKYTTSFVSCDDCDNKYISLIASNSAGESIQMLFSLCLDKFVSK
jgi:hypothetical protein